MISDFHLHTEFSLDAQENPENMVREAIRKGMKRICITDHQEIPPSSTAPNWERTLDEKTYMRVMQRLREKYYRQIDICIGMEIGLQLHQSEVFGKMVKELPLDFVIGSIHMFHEKYPADGDCFSGKNDEAAYQEAFEITLANIKKCNAYDVLGHVDYIVRYGKKQEESYSYNIFSDILDEILRYLIMNGKGLEVNTSGWKYGLSFPHPHGDILKRYKELGGEILTIGSDAHKYEHLGYDFHRVKGFLESCGFKYYTEFKERKPIFRQLT